MFCVEYVLYQSIWLWCFLLVKEKMIQGPYSSSCVFCVSEQLSTRWEKIGWRKFDGEGWTDRKMSFSDVLTYHAVMNACHLSLHFYLKLLCRNHNHITYTLTHSLSTSNCCVGSHLWHAQSKDLHTYACRSTSPLVCLLLTKTHTHPGPHKHKWGWTHVVQNFKQRE